MAKIMKKGDGETIYYQCSRSKKKGNFCLTHYKQSANCLLKYGEFKDDCRKTRRTRVPKKSSPHDIEVVVLHLEEGSYLFDGVTHHIYDMSTRAFIGVLEDDCSVKRRA